LPAGAPGGLFGFRRTLGKTRPSVDSCWACCEGPPTALCGHLSNRKESAMADRPIFAAVYDSHADAEVD
jgi:hypothetical protein